MITMTPVFLRDLVRLLGISGPSALGRRLDISKQHAALLWHGKVFPSEEMLKRLHDRLGIPAEMLLRLERERPAGKRGPKRPPAEEGPR